jgi:dihydrolipoamide dehydrogenase
MYDLGIIGGGPGGYVAAERAGHKGLKVVLFEQKRIGGVCLNEGCIPTKTLLYSAKIFDNAKDASKYGVTIPQVSFDFSKMMERKNKVVSKLVAGISASMKRFKVEVVNAKAEIIGKNANGIEIKAGDQKYECKNILICTGSEAFIPPIKGVDKSTIYTNREILDIKDLPSSITIIGGGVIGMEFASFFSSMGTKVTVVEMLPEILGGLDGEISAMLRAEMVKKGIEIHLNAKVVEIKGKDVIFEKDGKTESVSSDIILMSVGRKAVTQGFGLEKLGVELDRGGIKIDKHCRTNIPNVYAAGDVTGFSMLAHTASREGEVAVNNIADHRDIMRYNAIPGIVYTNPEVSCVGLTEQECKKNGIDYKVAKLPMSYAGRFMVENEGKNGLCKVIVGAKYEEILGVHMIGNPSSEMIYGAAMAIEAQLRVTDMKEIVFPHPTVSEILKETMFEVH